VEWESEGVGWLWDGERDAVGSRRRRRPMDDWSAWPSPFDRSAVSKGSKDSEDSEWQTKVQGQGSDSNI
jgi:hypothetical protein